MSPCGLAAAAAAAAMRQTTNWPAVAPATAPGSGFARDWVASEHPATSQIAKPSANRERFQDVGPTHRDFALTQRN